MLRRPGKPVPRPAASGQDVRSRAGTARPYLCRHGLGRTSMSSAGQGHGFLGQNSANSRDDVSERIGAAGLFPLFAAGIATATTGTGRHLAQPRDLTAPALVQLPEVLVISGVVTAAMGLPPR